MGFRRMIAGAVLAAVWGPSATSASAAPQILYELIPHGSTTISSTGDAVQFDVLALVTGTNLAASAFDNGQFALTSSTGGLLGDLSLTLGTTYNPTYNGASHVNVGVSNVPTAADTDGDGDKDIGSPTGGTGGTNDTIIAGIGIGSLSNALGGQSGTQTIGGVTYNVFPLGGATFTATGNQTSGATTQITLTPRGGLGTLVEPQVAFIDGTYIKFRGDDPANVGVVSPLRITFGRPIFHGPDANDDGFVDSLDFGILINNYFTSTTLGYHGADFNDDGFVDSSDFGILINYYGTKIEQPEGAELEPLPPSLAVAVPEPGSLALLAGIPLLARRRRAAVRKTPGPSNSVIHAMEGLCE